MESFFQRDAEFRLETTLSVEECIQRLKPLTESPARSLMSYGVVFRATPEKVVVGCNYVPDSAFSPIFVGKLIEDGDVTHLVGRFKAGPHGVMGGLIRVVLGILWVFIVGVVLIGSRFHLNAIVIFVLFLLVRYSFHLLGRMLARTDGENLRRALVSALEAREVGIGEQL